MPGSGSEKRGVCEMREALTCSGGWGRAPGTPWAAPCIPQWLLGVRTSPVGWLGAVCWRLLRLPPVGCALPHCRAVPPLSTHSSCHFDPNQGGLCRGQASPHHLGSQLSAVAPCGSHAGPWGPALPEARAAAALPTAAPPSHVCSWPIVAPPCTSWSGQRQTGHHFTG